MIASLKRAILHILDANSGVSVYSDEELDITDASINSFITKHMEKIFEDAGLRSAEFADNSGFKYHLSEYLRDENYFQTMSQFIAQRVYEGVSQSDKPDSSDLLVCDCIINERPTLAILKCDNKIGYTHQVMQEDGKVKNQIINHYAILPTTSQKISECAFINEDDFTIKYIGKRRKIDGETTDLIADVLLECIYDISPRESVNAVKKIAKKVTEENGGDAIETLSKMKEYITENVDEGGADYIETDKVAEKIFDGKPGMREEFMEKIEKASVPQRVEVNSYVTKKLASNVKIVTDIGVELTFPAEYYQNSEYIQFINNEDGTISIQINNIGEVINK
ncbi:MAG: nucleoid-associated protein [Oscillospiraceae bacterium]|nr:nucleoid-associated protein [Oscillospiraceae bacterium]